MVKGLNRLFEAPEIHACVMSFRFIVREAQAVDVQDAWLAAGLGLDEADIDTAVVVLEKARDWRAGERWGTYNIQRTYLDLLEEMGLREDSIPDEEGVGRGELAFYNLGKFSQAISDFEQIHFQSEPARKYEAFVGWLTHQAPHYYAESDADVGYATPDAVTLATVHQAKGLQWPAVFVPALRKNRFPSKRHGGVSVFHVIPDSAVPDADRYRGTVADEARLFYVAVTRAQKYLALSFSPGASAMYRGVSDFFRHASRKQARPHRRAPDDASPHRAPAAPRAARRGAELQRAQVPPRVPLPVQAAVPVRLQPTDPRGTGLREVGAGRPR